MSGNWAASKFEQPAPQGSSSLKLDDHDNSVIDIAPPVSGCAARHDVGSLCVSKTRRDKIRPQPIAYPFLPLLISIGNA